MVDIVSLLEMQGYFFLLVLTGVVFRRRLVGEDFRRGFSTLMVDLILPCNIISSFQISFERDTAARTAQILLISLAGQVLALILGKLLTRRTGADRSAVIKYAMICSNASFLGIPVAEGIWGAEGVLLTSVFLIPQRIVMWTIGLSWYTRDSGKNLAKKLLTNPCMVAVMIGLVLMFTGWRLPTALSSAVNSISRCTTAMSMFMVGMMIAHVRWRDFLDRQVILITAVRLLIFPAIFLGLCRLVHAEAMATGVAVVLMAMPVGASVAVVAARYRRAEDYAADLVTVSTLLSLATIPVWGLIVT